MEDCRIARQVAELNPQGEMRRGRLVNSWKGGIRDSMQRRNLEDGECFDAELCTAKNCAFWFRKTVYSQKNSYAYIM
jgi:hypothetical protein